MRTSLFILVGLLIGAAQSTHACEKSELTYVQLLQEYAGPATTKYQDALESGKNISQSRARWDACRRKIVNHFINAYFDPAKKNLPFNNEEYENFALPLILAQAATSPRAITALAMDLQRAWERRFLTPFVMQERVHNAQRRERLVAAVLIADLLVPFGPKYARLYLKTFRQLPKVRTLGRVRYFATRYGVRPAARLTPLLGGAAAERGLILMQPADVAEKVVEVPKVIPIAPAQVIEIIPEAGDLIQVNLENQEFWKDVAREAATIGGISYAFMAVREILSKAKVVAMPCLHAVIVAQVVGAVIGEAVDLISDGAQEAKLLWDLDNAANAFKNAMTAGTKYKTYEAMMTATALLEAATKLEVFYRLNEDFMGMHVPRAKSESLLRFEVGDLLEDVCTTDTGALDDESCNGLLAQWATGADLARGELYVRDLEERARMINPFIPFERPETFRGRDARYWESSDQARACGFAGLTSAQAREFIIVSEVGNKALKVFKEVPDSSETFADFASGLRDRAQRNAGLQLERGLVSTNPDHLMLQVSGFIRLMADRTSNNQMNFEAEIIENRIRREIHQGLFKERL